MERRDFIKLGLGAAAAAVLPIPEVVQPTIGGFTPRGEITIIAMNRYRQMALGEWLQEIGPSGRFKMAKYQEEIVDAIQSNLEAQLNS